MSKIKLFHFTSALHAPMILKEGLTKGDVPTSPQTGFTGVWMTRDGKPSHQQWGISSLVMVKGITHRLNKAKIRITILMDESDPLLHRWDNLARKVGIPTRFYKQLNRSGGGGRAMWYVFTGTIPPSKFDKVEYFNDGEWLILDEAWLPAAEVVQISMSELRGEKVEKQPVPWYLLGEKHASAR